MKAWGPQASAVFVAGMASVLLSTGCRATSVGLVIAAVGEAVTEVDARHHQKKLLDKSTAEADRALDSRRRMATWYDRLSQDHFLRYRLFHVGKLENFYAVRVTPAERIIDVNRWIEWSDGFEDTLKLAFMRPKVLGKTREQAETDGKLEKPLFVFECKGLTGCTCVYDATNFTHLRPRFFLLEFDKFGICRRARYYGIAGGAKLRLRQVEPKGLD